MRLLQTMGFYDNMMIYSRIYRSPYILLEVAVLPSHLLIGSVREELSEYWRAV